MVPIPVSHVFAACADDIVRGPHRTLLPRAERGAFAITIRRYSKKLQEYVLSSTIHFAMEEVRATIVWPRYNTKHTGKSSRLLSSNGQKKVPWRKQTEKLRG